MAWHKEILSGERWRWSWLEDLMRDLRHAARTLSRDKGFAATAILSLALGIGVNTTIFSLTSEFLFSQPSVREPATLMTLQVGGRTQVPMREYRFMRDSQVFPGLAGANPMQEVNWRTGDTTRRLFVSRVTENFFEVTGVPVAIGRGIGNGEVAVAVISHGFWRSRLNNDPGVLGRAILLDGQPHTIIGVLPDGHRTLTGFGYAPEMYLPVASNSSSVMLYGRMSEGVTRAGALAQLKSLASELDRVYPDGAHKWAREIYVGDLVGVERLTFGFLATVSTFFALLMAVVGLLLLIACANVASLLLARASTRVQEFAIRMSIGAGRGRLIRQMLAESLLLSGLGAAAGLTLNYSLTRALNGLVVSLPFPVKLSIQPDVRLLLYAALVTIGAALIAGLLPAMKSTRPETSALLKREEHQVSGRKASLRNLLVAGQLAVCVLMLIMAALSVRNLIQSASLHPGFDLQRTVWAQMRLVPESYPTVVQVRSKVASLLDGLRALPNIESATIAAYVPLNDHFASRTNTIYTGESAQGARIEYSWNAVGPDYLKTMGIDLVAGREFTAQDREGTQRVVIVNESMARKAFGGLNPIGRGIRVGNEDRSGRVVIGVAKGSKYSTIGERDRAALYEPFDQVGGGRTTLNFLVKANGGTHASIRPLTAAMLEADAASSVEVKPMSEATGFALLPSRMGAAMLGTIGLLGLVLAAVGFYGVLAYSISRRTREIGLRVALGAPRGRVLRLVLTEGAWILAMGLGAGIFLAVFVTRPLAKFLVPGLTPFDPLTYFVVAAVLIVAGLAASLTPALRALRIDPMAALRYE